MNMPLGRKVTFEHLTHFSVPGNLNSKFANVQTCHTLASLRSASLFFPASELTNTKFQRNSGYFWKVFKSNVHQK